MDRNAIMIKKAVKANNAVNAKVLPILNNSSNNNNNNFIFSPLSLTSAVAFLEAATRGTSKDQIRAVFDLDPDDENWSGGFSAIKKGKKVTLKTANKVIIKKCCEIKAAFKDKLRDNFKAEIDLIDDFNDPSTVDEVKEWVRSKTEGKIEELIEVNNGFDEQAITLSYFLGNIIIQWTPLNISTDNISNRLMWPLL